MQYFKSRKNATTFTVCLVAVLGSAGFSYWQIVSPFDSDFPTNNPAELSERYDRAAQNGDIYLPTPDGKQPPVKNSGSNSKENQAHNTKYGENETLVQTKNPENVISYAREHDLPIKEFSESTSDQTIITLKEAPSSSKVEKLVQETGAKASANYRYNVLDHQTPNDPKFSDQWNLQAISAPKAWDVTTGSNDTVIAIIDSGTLFEQTVGSPAETFTQPDFPAEKRWENSGETGMTAEGEICWTGASEDKSSNGCDDDGNGHKDDWQGWDFMGGWNGSTACPGHDPNKDAGVYIEEDNDPNPYSCDSPDHPSELNKTHFDGTCTAFESACYVGHGTMAASVAAATTNNGALMAGIDHHAQIMNLRVLDGYGFTTTSQVTEAVRYATQEGADVISLSLGLACSNNSFVDPVLEDAMKEAKEADVTVVAASGNGGNNNSVCYPASSSNAIAVGATNRDDKRASFSNGSDKLDVVAPGEDVPVANSPSNAYPANYYTGGSGTSFSTPHVAGLAGLIEAYANQITPDQKYEFITQGADKVANMNGKNRTNGYGYGRINIGTSLQLAIQAGYRWEMTNQKVYADQSHTQEVNDHIILAPGEKVYIRLTAKNIGYQTWDNSFLKLGTSKPRERISAFQDVSWPEATRPAVMNEPTVNPGEAATFEFTLAAPQETGPYRECFNVIAESRGWLSGKDVCYQVKVGEPPLDTLYSGWRLFPGEQLLSENGKTRLVLQRDGNLVLYAKDYGAVWASWTADSNADRLVMQGDGNLVLYDGGKALWASRTAGNGSSRLYMQNDGNLVVYAGGRATWASNTVIQSGSISTNSLRKGEKLNPGDSLKAGDYKAVLQGDGNFVVYKKGRPLWSSRTAGSSANRLILQGDGNLVLYEKSKAVWASRTAGSGANRLVMQGDGNLVLYSGGRAEWSTGTAQ